MYLFAHDIYINATMSLYVYITRRERLVYYRVEKAAFVQSLTSAKRKQEGCEFTDII